MKFLPTEIPEVILVEPDVHRDARGFFLETYHRDKYGKGGLPAEFVQDNHSFSRRGVLRGLHAQHRRPQGKLIHVIEGEVWDVAVDVRRGSPTFGRFAAMSLSGENFQQLYIPPGFAYGFYVTSEGAHLEYKCTDLYDPADEFTIAWNDPELAIPWPDPDPILSEKDRRAPCLRDVWDRLPVYPGANA